MPARAAESVVASVEQELKPTRTVSGLIYVGNVTEATIRVTPYRH